jgi:hypothetical protein
LGKEVHQRGGIDQMLQQISGKELIESLADIFYVVDLDGYIVDYSRRNWDAFAIDNGLSALAEPSKVLGRSIYDFISDEETRDSYSAFARALIRGHRDSVVFLYRCDAPEIKREMRMAITPLFLDNKMAGLVYHSAVLVAQLRPALNFLKPEKGSGRDQQLPVVSLCSYCKSVKFPPGDGGKWIAPEDYYRLGGSDSVTLSHSICPRCYKLIVEPVINAKDLES